MDATSATAALDALQAERTWYLSGPLLAACLEAGIPVSQLLLQHILLISVQDKTWRIAKEVLQVCHFGQHVEVLTRCNKVCLSAVVTSAKTCPYMAAIKVALRMGMLSTC